VAGTLAAGTEGGGQTSGAASGAGGAAAAGGGPGAGSQQAAWGGRPAEHLNPEGGAAARGRAPGEQQQWVAVLVERMYASGWWHVPSTQGGALWDCLAQRFGELLLWPYSLGVTPVRAFFPPRCASGAAMGLLGAAA
jgi:hypothetical protein